MPALRDTSRRHLRRGSGFIDRFFRRATTQRRPDPERVREPNPALIDVNTRTFWARGADAPTTLIETRDAQEPRPRRAAALVEAHERGMPAPHARPRANPAFTEALFVELMRAHQYQRAFSMLAPECRAAWRSVDDFAVAQGGGPMHRLRGVRVLQVRYLTEWSDASHGRTYAEVAELDVEYTVGTGAAAAVVPRTVHLVAGDGRWQSLCYPA